MVKFRTMVHNTPDDLPTHKMTNPHLYITRIGRFLRRYSLDETPQLINILKGNMSLIGPRPALWNQYDLIAERDKFGANDILPGLTGLAQVSGRDELSITAKAQLDGYYAQHVGLWLDIKILWLTLITVVSAKGVVEGRQDEE
jgi:O-antigen biosynthesis protein WbqP